MSEGKRPSVFVSHGAPTLVLDDSPAKTFLESLGRRLGRSRAILCVSAHWETAVPAVSAAANPATIHDFGGFPEELHRIRYPAPGAPWLAERVATLLGEQGLNCEISPDRGLDHGAWVPLMLMYRDASIPATQLSVQPTLGPRHHLRVGRALETLRAENVLVLGAGSAVHNLRYFRPGGTAVPAWARRFDDWLADVVTAGDAEMLANYRDLAPDAAIAHPTDEHLLPLAVAMGAGGDGARGRVMHRGFMDGGLSMAAFAFD
ncbi:MAG: dioxygenase [Rhodospirillales bacterium]|nr:dioxygenase [Rhodospirillales bacterium]